MAYAPICETKDHHGRWATVVFLPDLSGLAEPIYKCDECAERMEEHGWVSERLPGEPQEAPDDEGEGGGMAVE